MYRNPCLVSLMWVSPVEVLSWSSSMSMSLRDPDKAPVAAQFAQLHPRFCQACKEFDQLERVQPEVARKDDEGGEERSDAVALEGLIADGPCWRNSLSLRSSRIGMISAGRPG